MNVPSIIIVDDHDIFRTSLKSFIEIEEIGIVIGIAKNGIDFLTLLDKALPDLVLMDIEMPLMNGVEASKLAIEKYPELKILTLSMFGNENYYNSMIDAGVKGFLLKNSEMAEFEIAIKEILDGGNYFSNALLRNIIANLSKKQQQQKITEIAIAQLTERELEVLKHICNGYTNEEIAEMLHVSVKTVKTHRANLLEKTGTKNAPSMVMYCIKNNIIEI